MSPSSIISGATRVLVELSRISKSLSVALTRWRSASTVMGFVAWEVNLTKNSKGGLPERDSVGGADSDMSTLGGCGRS